MPNSVTLHTGNISTIMPSLATKNVSKSQDEFEAALNNLAQNQREMVQVNGVFTPADNLVDEIPLKETKITVKVFLRNFSSADALDAAKKFADVCGPGGIACFIIAFPHIESENMENDEWLATVLPVWTQLEELVDDNKVFSLGVADLDAERLKLLYDASPRHPPEVNHFSIDGCCTVPQDLVTFAREHYIQLLTHNDNRHCDLSDSIKPFVAKLTGQDLVNYKESYVVRYTIWVRSRSVMAAKGYLAHYVSEE